MDERKNLMKTLGNITSGICLVICSLFVLNIARDGAEHAVSSGDDYPEETLGFVALISTIGVLLLTTGLRLLSIRVILKKTK